MTEVVNTVSLPLIPNPPQCFMCERGGSFTCARCSKIHYCSRECQRAHWPDHKLICGKTADEIAAVIEDRRLTKILTINNKIMGNIAIAAAWNPGKVITVTMEQQADRYNHGLMCAMIGVSDSAATSDAAITIKYAFDDYTKIITIACEKSMEKIRETYPLPGDEFPVIFEY